MIEKRKYQKSCIDFVPQIFDPIKLAYLAGIVDGEGCFWIGTIRRKYGDGYVNNHYRGVLKVCNTDERLIQWMIDNFQGTHSAQSKHQPKAKLNRMVYDWVVTGERLLDISHQLMPYLVIKKEQCQIMIKFRNTYVERAGSNQIKPENLAIRAQCVIDIRQHNSRFHNHPLKIHNQQNT